MPKGTVRPPPPPDDRNTVNTGDRMGDHHKRIRRCSVGKEGLFSPPLVSLPPQTSTSRNGEGGGIFRCKGPSSDPLELRGMGLRSGSSSSSGGSDKENAAPARPNSLSSSMDTVGIRAVAPARPAPTTTSTSTLTSLSTSTATSSYHPHRNARLGRPSKGAGGPGPPQLLIPMLRDDGETPLARKKMSTKKSTKNKSDNVAISGAPSGATVSGTLSPLLPSPEGPARRRGGAGGLFGPDSRGGGGLFGSDPISSPIPSPIRSVPAVARRAHVRVRSLASEARKMSVDLMDSNPEDDDGDENGGNEVHTEPTPAASSTPPRIPLRLPSRPSPIPDFHGSVGGSAAVGPTRPSLSPRMGAGLGLAPRVTLTRRPSSKVVGLKRRNISPVGTLPSSTRAPVLPQSPSLPPPMPGQRGRRRHADAGGLADHLDDRATLALPGFGSAPLAAGPGLFGDTTPNALDASPTAMETTVDSNCHRSVAGGGSRSGSSPSPTETPRGSLRGGGGFLPFSFASAAATPRASPHPGAAASAGPDGRGLFQSPHWSRSVHINPFSPVPSQYLNVEEVEGGCDAFGDILVDLNGSTGGGGGDGVDERYYSVNGSPLRSPRPFRVSLSSPKSSPRPMDAPPPTARKSNNKRALRARLLDSYPVSTSWDEMDDENDYTKDNSAPFYPKTKRRNSLDGNIPNVEEESLFGTRDNVIFRSGAPLGGRKSSGKTTEVSPVDVAGFPCVPLAADSPTLMGMTPLNPAKRRNGRGARHHLSPFSAPPASPLRTSNSPKLSFAYMPSASPSWSPTTRARPSYYRRPTPFKPSQPPPLERGGHHHHHHYDDDADLLRSPHWTGSKEDTRLQRSHPLTPHGGHESSSQCRVSRFEEDFQAVGRLGTGSFGTVHKVISRLDGCLYAVKVMKRPVRGDLDRRQTLKEVHALAALCGQSDASAFHIVRYHQAWMEDGLVHIQIELCESTLVHEMKGGMLNGDDRRYKLLREMLLALELIHRNEMVHLDIKVRCTIWYWEA